ncbi:MAG: alpha/beta hydrolase [Bacillota bacterium]|nr:alpha/beta hydrolase [Bacillota bacterium]
MKKKISIISIILLILIVTGFYIIKNLTETDDGKISTYAAVNLQLDKILNPVSLKGKSIKEIRQHLNNQSVKWSKAPILFKDIKNLTITAGSDKIPVRIYTPDTKGKLPIIIYSHGGFWVGGNLDTCDNICRKLSMYTKVIVISVDYRLAPENPFPEGLNDIYDVLKWTYENSESINGDKNLIAIAGDSAGGNLSAAVSLMARDKNSPKIICAVLIYPSTDVYNLSSKSWSYFDNKFNISKEDMQKFISLYIPGKEDRKLPYASPLLARNLKNLPDTFVITAEIDPLRDEGEAYAEKLKEAGNKVYVKEYEGAAHGFVNMDKITNKADEALNDISLYLQKEFQKK